MLGVSPNTLRSWERRYGFPRPRRSPGGHRQYALGEIESLRVTLAETHNVSSAIALARQRGEGPSSGSRLAAAFAAFDEDKANGLLEESLALRSVERTVEEVLLAGSGDPQRPDAGVRVRLALRHGLAVGGQAPVAAGDPSVRGARARRLLAARARRAIRPGPRADAAPRRGPHPVAVDRDHAQPPGSRAARAGAEGGRARRPRHLTRRARAGWCTRSGRSPTRLRSTTIGARYPTPVQAPFCGWGPTQWRRATCCSAGSKSPV